MPKDLVSGSISHMEFIRHIDEIHEVIFDPAARAYLATLQDQDLMTWMQEQAPIIGENFAIYCKGQAPKVQITTPPTTPREAKLLLCYILPRQDRECIIGDLEEEYSTIWLPEFGARHARRLFWWHAIWSIAPMLWTGVRRSAIITALLGAADWLRDRLG